MKLYNFTNHEQNSYLEFFKQYGFDEVTAPMHPEITPEMSEEEVAETIQQIIIDLYENRGGEILHFLVGGMTNVCFYAVSTIQHWITGAAVAYYVKTNRVRDNNDRFVFIPLSLERFAEWDDGKWEVKCIKK